MSTRRGDDLLRFEAAKSQARQAIEKAPAGDAFSLIFLTAPAQTIVVGPAEDRDKILQEIDDLVLPHGAADIPGGLNLIAEMTNRPLGKFRRREVVILTDLRRSAWPLPKSATEKPTPHPATDVWGRILTAARVAFIDVAEKETDNVTVSSLAVTDPMPLVNVDLPVNAIVTNHGRTAREKVPVELLIGKAGDRFSFQSLGQQLVDLPANTSVNVVFLLDKQNRIREPGQYVLQVRVAEDQLKLDDVRSLALTVRDAIPVMVVNGKPSAEPLERASGFLTRALNPFAEGETHAESPARVKVLNPREFQDAGLGDLFKPDAPTEIVFLCDLPSIGSNEAQRLEAHLKRGGSVVMALGPNAASNLDSYNRVLFNEGKGLLPGPLLGVKRAEPGQHYSLLAADDAFKQPPLNSFQSEQERASFTTPRFNRYVKLDLPPNASARRLFSFLPSKRDAGADRLDPAIIEWNRHRGKVLLILSSVNVDWNEWPRTLSFAPFLQEVLRSLVKPSGRQTVTAGDPLEEYLPANFVGLSAKVTYWDTDQETALESLSATAQDEAALFRLPRAERSGIYRVTLGKSHSLFAVNVPQVTTLGGSESDLRRLSSTDLQSAFPSGDVILAGQVSDIPKVQATNPGTADEVERAPRGPEIARVCLLLLFVLLLVETYFAWRFGSARAGDQADPRATQPIRWLSPLWLLPLLTLVLGIFVAVHGVATGNFLGFLPWEYRNSLERALGVPEAAPGEGTRWRLESRPPFTGERSTDQWLAATLLIAAGLFAYVIYRREKTGGASLRRGWRHPTTRMLLLRMGLIAATLGVLLPQLRLAFEREGWPDVVLIIDRSRSMSIVDNYRDPAVKERVSELWNRWEKAIRPKRDELQQRITELRKSPDRQAEADRLERVLRDWQIPHRLNLVKAILQDGDGEWLQTLLGRRQVRLHVYFVDAGIEKIASLDDSEQRLKLLDTLREILPEGESSELGNGLLTVLKAFRGESLNAAILFSDGVTTTGEDLPNAGRAAARAGVPVYIVGVGDAAEPPDLSLGELRAEDAINVNDRLVIEAKVKSQGTGMPDSIPVTLEEVVEGRTIEHAREVVRLDLNGNPVRVKFVHQPKTAGEKKFIIRVPVLPEESDTTNNRLEHRVYVAEAKTLRVLMIEGYPRFDYRYLKSLYEREADRGQRAVELDVFLATASPEAPKQDRSAVSRVPTYDELKKYDVVLLGDVDPKQLPRGDLLIEALTRFVREHGGGLMVLAGEQASPHAYRDTSLADILPVICDGPPAATSEVLRESYRPRLTPAGQSHPLFRFSVEEAENAQIFNRLMPLYWHARGYRRKLSAEVLAVHPDKPAESAPQATGASKDENHPLVLQQFAGAGRVIFLGFDESWRWRLRENEVHFNQFWLQAIRTLARGRVGRVEVRTDRRTYRRDESIRISVRFPDEAPPPEGAVRVRVDRRPRPGEELDSRTIQLSAKEGTRSTFEAIMPKAVEGDLTFTLVEPAIPRRPTCEAKVLPPPGEMDRVTMNEADLKRTAQESRGSYYTLSETEKLLDDLPSGRRVALDQPCEPISLWNHWAIFGLFLWILTAEWIIRKRWKLL